MKNTILTVLMCGTFLLAFTGAMSMTEAIYCMLILVFLKLK